MEFEDDDLMRQQGKFNLHRWKPSAITWKPKSNSGNLGFMYGDVKNRG